MSGQSPAEIWDQGAEEGERRVNRSFTGLIATGLIGGTDVMLGVVALAVTTGALATVLPEHTAHVIGSFTFGIGFVLLLIGRSELFTENFLVPVITVVRDRASILQVVRLWAGTLLGNVAVLLALSWGLTRSGVVTAETLDAAGEFATTFARRDLGAAFLSAVLAGTLMTLLTWLAHATESASALVIIALAVGFVLAAPSLNHAVVSVGEMAFGILSGRGEAEWVDLAQNFPVSVLGNLIGGLGFVTITRLVQVQGEPG